MSDAEQDSGETGKSICRVCVSEAFLSDVIARAANRNQSEADARMTGQSRRPMTAKAGAGLERRFVRNRRGLQLIGGLIAGRNRWATKSTFAGARRVLPSTRPNRVSIPDPVRACRLSACHDHIPSRTHDRLADVPSLCYGVSQSARKL